MNITTTITKELFLGDAWKTRNVRSDLADRIEKYWVGKPKSMIGLQYLELVDGTVKVRKFCCERADVLLFQAQGVCNAFIEADGSIDVQYWDGVQTSKKEHDAIKAAVKKFFEDEREYVDHERRFLESKPWEQVDGMTPEAAVAKMREMGW